jgi:hypothetical protein
MFAKSAPQVLMSRFLRARPYAPAVDEDAMQQANCNRVLLAVARLRGWEAPRAHHCGKLFDRSSTLNERLFFV